MGATNFAYSLCQLPAKYPFHAIWHDRNHQLQIDLNSLDTLFECWFLGNIEIISEYGMRVFLRSDNLDIIGFIHLLYGIYIVGF